LSLSTGTFVGGEISERILRRNAKQRKYFQLNLTKISFFLKTLPSRSCFQVSNFCTLSVSLNHVYMRMYGSRPLTLNACHGRGFDRISLTVP